MQFNLVNHEEQVLYPWALLLSLVLLFSIVVRFSIAVGFSNVLCLSIALYS